MLHRFARHLAAVALGAALVLPSVAAAQSPAPSQDAKAKQEAPAAAAPKAAPTTTAAPGWNNPPSWDAVSETPQYASIPGRETNRLIQGAGREWRALRNGPLTQFGGWVIVAVLALLALVYLIAGPIKLHAQPTGRLIERFNAIERTVHWTTAISFVVLALTGIVMLFGKYLILPWLGYTGFSWLTIVSKNLHNFVGPLFMFAIVVMFLIYVKDNLVGGEDFKWLTRIGGIFSGKEYPSGRFNALEKLWFWLGLVVLGAAMSVTGIILDFPNWNQAREVMQTANIVHIVGAALFIAGALGHIYVGTIGMVGAYRAMREGYVDVAWAKEHHEKWYEEVNQGKRPEKIMPAGATQPAGDD